VDPETGAIEYKAQSPDEAALVQAAADIGFVFRGRDKEILSLQTPFSEEVEKYELLDILDFTSARKRMSVVVRKLQGNDSRLFLLTKGADNVIFERLKTGADLLKEKTGSHLDEFASEGLRTLTLAYKVISEAEYETWSRRYQEASVALEDRDQKIEEICNELEQDLRLLGATAIEDRLQDGVPETIADLKRAGIKIWVATGDKLETAIAIGHSTNLIGRDSNIIVVRGGGSRSVYDQMANALEEFFPEHGLLAGLNEKGKAVQPRAANPPQSVSEDRHGLHRVDTGVSSIVGADNGNRPGGFVLVIDGAALSTALADDEHKRLLLSLGTQCEGVICCRVSPLQKALVVKLVKDNLGVMTLAIGDGANDVSMIQASWFDPLGFLCLSDSRC
jgi:phospholipid-translocating ATPase